MDRLRLLPAAPTLEREWAALFHRDAFGEIARLVDIGAFENRHVIGQQLDRNRVEQRGDERVARGHGNAVEEPPRAMTSSTFDNVFSKRSSLGANTMTGTLSSIRAIGPCFISPAA